MATLSIVPKQQNAQVAFPQSDKGQGNSQGNNQAKDISGYAVFAQGAMGSAHAMAHQMLDSGRFRLGHQRLAEWFEGRSGSGSQWVHLHFHMAVFELALGDWNAAYTRFLDEVLPTAATTEDALTDAPALLWRLAVSSPESIDLPWQPLRQTASAYMHRTDDPFVQVHNLLAFAGAGDIDSIDQWLLTHSASAWPRRDRLVSEMAIGLKSVAIHSYRRAATSIKKVLPHIASVGGSHAQNQLFEQLVDWCSRQTIGTNPVLGYADAA